MLHVLTVHFRSDAWITPQLDALARHAGPDVRTWAVLDGIDERWHERFDHVVEHEGTHPQRLNALAERVLAVAAPDDQLLFIDGDALPIAPLGPLRRAPEPLVAVRRDENLGDPQPHPCFCLTSVAFWRDFGGDWRGGYRWTNANGDEVTDVGGRLLGALRGRDVAWRALTRRNTRELHPLWFGVYGDDTYGPVAYHHGAGFRARVARVDGPPPRRPTRLIAPRVPGLARIERRWRARRSQARHEAWLRSAGADQQRIADEVFASLVSDPDFFRRFLD